MELIRLLLIGVFAALSCCVIFALFRRLQRLRVQVGWWIAFVILFGSGIAIGIWCALCCEYHAGPSYRIASFPIPIDFFHLEDGAWVDFPVPQFQAWLTIATNIVILTALATLPLWLIASRQKTSLRLQFYFDDLPVGYFSAGIYPSRDGDVRYMAYRGMGHYRLTVAFDSLGEAQCYFKRDNETVRFKVIRRPRNDVLSICLLSSNRDFSEKR